MSSSSVGGYPDSRMAKVTWEEEGGWVRTVNKLTENESTVIF